MMEKSCRTLSSFPLTPAQKVSLCKGGYSTVSDICGTRPTQLAKELNISNKEALEILVLIRSSYDNIQIKPTRTALDLLREEENVAKIVTFSQSIDDILDGGVTLSKITEFCGAPGIGKTQIGMQLAVDVQLPNTLGGVSGEAVYIDTEGSFIVERLAEIATNTITHCQQMAARTGEDGNLSSFTLDHVLSHIHYYRCCDYVELLATVHLLPEFIKTHPQVKLIVVDSIAFHFRHDFTDLSLRTRLLTGLAQSFIRLATTHQLAVVLTNQMTTKFNSGPGTSQSQLVPALGESWGHASTVRVVLYWRGTQRFAQLYKSPTHKDATVPFQITTAGIRDVVTDTNSQNKNQNSQTSFNDANLVNKDSHTPEPPQKRYRTDT